MSRHGYKIEVSGRFRNGSVGMVTVLTRGVEYISDGPHRDTSTRTCVSVIEHMLTILVSLIRFLK